MSPHTDLIESAASAFSRAPKPSVGTRLPYFYGHVRGARRTHDRGLIWVRITLFVVVSALLLSIVSSSRARTAAGDGTAPRNIPDER